MLSDKTTSVAATANRQVEAMRHGAHLVADEVKPVPKEHLPLPPSKEDLVRRQALVAKILTNAEHRLISPLTTADLLHQARAERRETHARWPR